MLATSIQAGATSKLAEIATMLRGSTNEELDSISHELAERLVTGKAAGSDAVAMLDSMLAGATVVFSPAGSYIDAPGCNRVPLTASKGVYNLKMWVPRNQRNPFQGQA